MRNKLLKSVFACVLALGLLTGCGAPAASVEESGSKAEETTSVATGELKPIAKEDLKVGFIHVSDPSDKGYTYNHDLGTKEMQKALGLSDDQIVNKFNVPEGAEVDTAIKELIEAGCQIIFGTSFGFEDYMKEAAAAHPEIQFCHATGYQAASSGLPNMHNYFTSIYEARYLAGIAAGLKTQTNKLGYVAAFPFAEVISGYTAFYLGAKSVNPEVTMDIMYTNSWNDPTVESQVAKALIERGCDVISQHSDSTAPATTAEENNVWQVGYNNDMIEAAPKASLVSARINWGIYVTLAVQSMIDGKAIPVDWCQGLAEGAVFLSPLNEEIAAEGTQKAIDEAAAKIKSGEIKVFAGPLKGESPEGEKIELKEGEHFDESKEASAPSWSYVIEGCEVIK